jgi:hypothetical protein
MHVGSMHLRSDVRRAWHRGAAWIFLIAMVAFGPPASRAVEPELSPITMPIELTNDIKGQPLSILAKFPRAGPSLAGFVAKELAKQPNVIDAILSIIPDTSPEQASAIGAGIVRAVRSIAAKNPEFVSQISEKILRSENVALKTTFFALGPRKITYASAGASLPVATQSFAGGGGSVGEVLPVDKARLGSPDAPYVYPYRLDVVEKIGNGLDKERIGMIVALVSSDAENNGAVSTSPTH